MKCNKLLKEKEVECSGGNYIGCNSECEFYTVEQKISDLFNKAAEIHAKNITYENVAQIRDALNVFLADKKFNKGKQ